MTYFNGICQTIDCMEKATFNWIYHDMWIEAKRDVFEFILDDLKSIDGLARSEITYLYGIRRPEFKNAIEGICIQKTDLNSVGNHLSSDYILAIRKAVAIYRQAITSKHNWNLSEDEISQKIIEIYQDFCKQNNFLSKFNWNDNENLLFESTFKIPVNKKLKSLRAMVKDTNVEGKVVIFLSSHKSSLYTPEGKLCTWQFEHPQPRVYVYGNLENMKAFFEILKNEARDQNDDKIKVGPRSLQKLVCKKIVNNLPYYQAKEEFKSIPLRMKIKIIKTSP